MTGPKFTPRLTLGEGDTTFDGSEWAKGRAVPMWPCSACTEIATLDDPTGLCKPCWRVWRFQDDIIQNIGREVWLELGHFTFVKRGGTAIDFSSFCVDLLRQAGGIRKLLAEWEPET